MIGVLGDLSSLIVRAAGLIGAWFVVVLTVHLIRRGKP